MDIVMECRNVTFKLFIKERRNSLEFSEILSLLSMIYVFHVCRYWKGCKSLINNCYLHESFCSFCIILVSDEVMVEVISFYACRSFLIIFLLLFKYLDQKPFLIEIFLCSFFLLRIDLRMSAVIHGFFQLMRKPPFLTILYAWQNLKESVIWALLGKSVGRSLSF